MEDWKKLREAWFDGDVENLSKLKPPYWVDNMPDPLDTVADVEDLFARVDKLKAARLEAAIVRASKN
jgi:hypothetical protein